MGTLVRFRSPGDGSRVWPIDKAASLGLPTPPAMIFDAGPLGADAVAELTAAVLHGLRDRGSHNALAGGSAGVTVEWLASDACRRRRGCCRIAPCNEVDLTNAVARILTGPVADTAAGMVRPLLSAVLSAEVSSAGGGVGMATISSEEREVLFHPNLTRLEALVTTAPPEGMMDLQRRFPEAAQQLARVLDTAALASGGRAVEVDFATDGGRLWVEGARHPHLRALQRVRIAARLAQGGQLSDLLGLEVEDVRGVTTPRAMIDPRRVITLCSGGAAAPGAVVGVLCLSVETALRVHASGTPVIFAAGTPRPEHMPAVAVAAGLVFSTGGTTSHVAVIARGARKPCLMGAQHLRVSEGPAAVFGDVRVDDGSWVTVDGDRGRLYLGRCTISSEPVGAATELAAVLGACDEIADVQVFANADTSSEVSDVLASGARGIGLCRLEHLLAHPERLPLFQRVLVGALRSLQTAEAIAVARDACRSWGETGGPTAVLDAAVAAAASEPDWVAYQGALAGLEHVLTDELRSILESAQGRPVVVRLIDAPLHEFLAFDCQGTEGVAEHVRANDMLGLPRRSPLSGGPGSPRRAA